MRSCNLARRALPSATPFSCSTLRSLGEKLPYKSVAWKRKAGAHKLAKLDLTNLGVGTCLDNSTHTRYIHSTHTLTRRDADSLSSYTAHCSSTFLRACDGAHSPSHALHRIHSFTY
eukprot:5281583-Pleurochrysis_carterae.AAC.2